MKVIAIFFSCLAICSFVDTFSQEIQISSDFPGGNIIVNKISGDTVWLEPDLSFTEGPWFYWFFKVTGISDRRIRFQFEHDNVFAKYGPAYSINNDDNWKWYGENRVKNNSFSYTFSPQDTIASFGVAFPYTDRNLKDFVAVLNYNERLRIDTLCISPEKRAIEKIIISAERKIPKYKVLLTARHHACETMANYVLEGIIESILHENNLEFLRENVEFLIIPFMDKDGVENGEQGKNRIPRDHNRDYEGQSQHKSTAALRELVPTWNDGKLSIALDLHCPWITGDNNEAIYIVGNPDPMMEENQIIFSQLLENYSTGEIKSYHRDFISFGTAWNIAANYSKGMSFGKWAGTQQGIELAGTIEFPYANVSGTMVSKDGARVFGKSVAYSIQEFLLSSR